MSFLQKIFSKQKDDQQESETSLDVTTAKGIEKMLKAHLKRLDESLQNRPQAKELRKLCKALLEPIYFYFPLQEIEKNLPNSLASMTPYRNMQCVGGADFCIAVQILPTAIISNALDYMPNGYTAVLKRDIDRMQIKTWLLIGAPPPKKWVHYAHWTYCCDGKTASVHLTLLPEAQNSEAKPQVTLFAEELLNPLERDQIGLTHLG